MDGEGPKRSATVFPWAGLSDLGDRKIDARVIPVPIPHVHPNNPGATELNGFVALLLPSKER